MKIDFYKYQGTGNDFILIDNRDNQFDKTNTAQIAAMCDRRFGIGADGLILLENHSNLDFTMVYYNADGKQSTMCGNGGRCIVHFANKLQIITDSAHFMAVDGEHNATINNGQVRLQMQDVSDITVKKDFCFLDTGSPHHVSVVPNVDAINVAEDGARIRYNNYGSEGANINFVSQVDAAAFKVRTYERGVEAETLSCGTGVTAAAIAMHKTGKTKFNTIKLITLGGALEVTFMPGESVYSQVFLSGPATFVFQGIWN